MAGNSMKSDVLPALEAGAFAVHIPYVITWAHELADAPENHARFGALENIADLPAWIEQKAGALSDISV
jgi:putative hydrolase of the HAD superfamily